MPRRLHEQGVDGISTAGKPVGQIAPLRDPSAEQKRGMFQRPPRKGLTPLRALALGRSLSHRGVTAGAILLRSSYEFLMCNRFFAI